MIIVFLNLFIYFLYLPRVRLINYKEQVSIWALRIQVNNKQFIILNADRRNQHYETYDGKL